MLLAWLSLKGCTDTWFCLKSKYLKVYDLLNFTYVHITTLPENVFFSSKTFTKDPVIVTATLLKF